MQTGLSSAHTIIQVHTENTMKILQNADIIVSLRGQRGVDKRRFFLSPPLYAMKTFSSISCAANP